MHIAVVADIHGNLPALDAVLDEIGELSVDVIVVAGDITAGPAVIQCLETMESRPEPVYWVRGNADRETVAAYDDPKDAGPNGPGQSALWGARSLTTDWRDRLASWPTKITIDNISFCHASPRSDEEILTSVTDLPVLVDALAGVSEQLVVAGHTHRQFSRSINEHLMFANAGSVGLPYEGASGAYWMLVEDGIPHMRRTDYDLEDAIRVLRQTGFPELNQFLDGSLLNVLDPDWIASVLEHTAGRVEHPGEPIDAENKPER